MNPHLQHNQMLNYNQQQQQYEQMRAMQQLQALQDQQRLQAMQMNQQPMNMNMNNPQQTIMLLEAQLNQLKQSMMQGNQQPMNMPVNNPSRFGNNSPQTAMMNTNQRVTSFQDNQQSVSSSRFGNPPQNQQPTQRQQQPQVTYEEPISQGTTSMRYTITPTNFKFNDNTKITLSTITNKFNPATMFTVTEPKAYCEDVSVLETLTNSLLKEGESKSSIIHTSGIFTHEFYKVDITDKVINTLTKTSAGVYKALKTNMKNCSDKFAYIVYEKLDKILTDKVNDYLNINTKDGVTIDKFSEDFNSLQTYLNENEQEDVSKAVNDYLDIYITAVHKATNSLTIKEGVSIISVPYSVGYIDKHSAELGLYEMDDKFITLEGTPPNEFLITFANQCFTTISLTEEELNEFYLFTMDKRKFYFTLNVENEVCIREVL